MSVVEGSDARKKLSLTHEKTRYTAAAQVKTSTFVKNELIGIILVQCGPQERKEMTISVTGIP